MARQLKKIWADYCTSDTGSTNRTQHSTTQLTKFVGCCVHNNQQMLSWYWVPNNQHPSFHKLVLCTQHQQLLGSVVYPTFFQKRSSMRKESFLPQGFFSCPKNKPVMAVFKFLKQVQQIMTIFEMFDLKLGQMLHNPTVVYPTTKLTNC